ncbi:helix-turn-helix domain-containing protein [Sporolituus thermophilus]|uniref:DNA-binding transcriptional regulator, XRE-family HTH domain n=1 Tax=Sporolituus thermophilus DSM 23256 TaxID=1123285 RepID=A0A1G7KXV2_9FIRM|nr:helix-turn-helix transcriptional regulator [Sporolituus thermophilus]SDF42023.1 DNA-binding transcriptional regulator, XRE-family HTH domain [Sporolituus thermophilus DSM 23256]
MPKLTKMKILRMQKGLTQHDLAKMLGVSQSYVAKVENEQIKPTQDILLALAEVLGCRPDELV